MSRDGLPSGSFTLPLMLVTVFVFDFFRRNLAIVVLAAVTAAVLIAVLAVVLVVVLAAVAAAVLIVVAAVVAVLAVIHITVIVFHDFTSCWLMDLLQE